MYNYFGKVFLVIKSEDGQEPLLWSKMWVIFRHARPYPARFIFDFQNRVKSKKRSLSDHTVSCETLSQTLGVRNW